MSYDKEAERKLLNGEPVEIGHNIDRAFAKEFATRNKTLLYKVAADDNGDYMLSMRCGYKGTHYVIISVLDHDDKIYALETVTAQVKGSNIYYDMVQVDVHGMAIKILREDKAKAE